MKEICCDHLSPSRNLSIILALVCGSLAVPALAGYHETNLVSDIPGVALVTDPNLKNPWGMSSSMTSPIWVSDNKTGLTTLYNGDGQPFPLGSPLVVTIPPPGGAPLGTIAAPTGQVFNDSGGGFNGAVFMFATEDGTISYWKGGTSAVLAVDSSPSGAVYKGLAIAGNRLYAANFNAGRIDVFDNSFSPITVPGGFIDPNIPAGFAPFNIQNIGGTLYVTYAQQDAAKHDDVAGAGNGFVDAFNADGVLQMRVATNGNLNSPWGLALAPAGFGDFSNDLLVGNFGDGRINAFDPSTDAFLGQLTDGSGNPITIEGLWGLRFGNGGNGGDPNALFFTAGIPGDGSIEDHGLFGRLTVPEPGTLMLLVTALGLVFAGMAKRRNLH
jgi:uncharacterized protein (TIGR03118 family)